MIGILGFLLLIVGMWRMNLLCYAIGSFLLAMQAAQDGSTILMLGNLLLAFVSFHHWTMEEP